MASSSPGFRGRRSEAWIGAACGLFAAALFGISAPLAKLLLRELPPLLLSGLLYLGAGAALFLVEAIPGARSGEPALKREDAPVLAGVVFFGGVLGPALLLFGLARVTGVTGALLLNLEAPFTMAIAIALFGEHLSRRELVAAAVIVLGAAALSAHGGHLGGSLAGMALVALACLSWGVDNNLTQRLSSRDPRALVRFKATAAGLCSLVLAVLFGQWQGPTATWGLAAALGAVSYGASITLDVLALRYLGAAREAALFATAPFAGAIAAVPLLGESIGLSTAIAMAVMAFGVVALLRARHSHLHVHEALEHEHLHVHDEHHQHAHPPGTPMGEPHSHPHRHTPLAHDHPHVDDVHHRHAH